jgi:ABC-2 type transport system ATP-binding protein
VPSRNDHLAIDVREVHKHFGPTHALDGVNLAVQPGEVVGLLGPNGAGKTTLVRILATLLRPTQGTVKIFGTDTMQAPDVVREQISLTGQYAAVDGLLSGRENLMMFSELLGLAPADARRRASELLERFDLTSAADRPARQYSGGMRRRLDLASSLVVAPRLLFLDEPTTGLDPRTRTGMWEVIRELAAAGTTLLLTTQYLEEADQLADRIVVIDHGRIIADGTGDELKDRAGNVAVEVLLLHPADCERATRLLCVEGLSATVTQGPGAHLEVATTADDGLAVVQRVAAVLQSEGVRVKDLGLRRPTLDDVFLDLTGASATGAGGAGATAEVVEGEGERQRAGGRGSEGEGERQRAGGRGSE